MLKRAMTMGLVAAATACGTMQAFAADLDQIIYAPELDRTVPVEIGNGWYLRGDIGYSVETDGGLKRFTYQGVEYDLDDLDLARIDSDISAGGGVGYQFSDFFRADVTAEYSEGEGAINFPGIASDADFDAITLMANAYVDLGTVAGFTPYIGAGIGSTRVDWGPLRADTIPSSTPIEVKGDAEWRLTYALMAGVSYDITKSLKLDVGYRYLDVADGSLFNDALYGSGEDDGFSKHEIRAGVRYALW
ncbi:outer membrane protein [Pararhizobium haloflavum]|uniref:outer membrane protein n=1 Tax=Pararhizobium haloflavum TaxID=2037914 RepID=UPI001FDED20B|nr:outer membrane protein [Pararhizobium haloflavum]